jgi:hypothetical protein
MAQRSLLGVGPPAEARSERITRCFGLLADIALSVAQARLDRGPNPGLVELAEAVGQMGEARIGN